MNKSNRAFETEELEQYFKTKKFGDTVTFEELQPLTHYDLQDEYECYKFKFSLMGTVKNKLIRNGIVLKAIKEVGYYILKPNQIQSYTYRTYIMKPLRHLEKAEIILVNTKTDKLNQKELEKHKLTLDLDINLIKETNRLINEKKYSNLE